MKNTLIPAWVIIVAFACLFLAVPAVAEREKQTCKAKEPAPALCYRVVAKHDHHPGPWMTVEAADNIWQALWSGQLDMRNYRMQVRKNYRHEECRAHVPKQ